MLTPTAQLHIHCKVLSLYFDFQLPPLAPNIFYFSNHQETVFFFFFFLLLPLQSSVLQWHHEQGNFLSEFDQSNWLFYVGYYLEAFSPILYSSNWLLPYQQLKNQKFFIV